jgi:hypothetical protein
MIFHTFSKLEFSQIKWCVCVSLKLEVKILIACNLDAESILSLCRTVMVTMWSAQ